jgi:DNA recombination protein RmuC
VTGTAGLVIGLLIGLVVAGLLSWLWWRARFVAIQAERDAIQGVAITEITQASARAAADVAAQQFRLASEQTEHLASEDLERRQKALESSVGELVRPVREQLEQYRERVDGLQNASTRLHGELKNQLEQLAQSNLRLERETSNLVGALRRPEIRGGWGEQTLRRIVELAGMVEHCDFDEQVHLANSDGGRQRPDLVVHLPNQREVIVDAKVPLDAYLEALAEPDQSLRDAHMRRHAAQLRTHVDALAKREYQQSVAGSVDFVVAFIPSDPLLSAAYEFDPAIVERAIANHVIIATPTTLIALLRAVAYGWQQEAVARNAQEIADAGRELYKRLRTFTGHFDDLGKRLRGTVDAYNSFLSSLERRVMPQARRFEELGAVNAAEDHLAESAPIAELPQHPVLADLVPIEAVEADEHLA